MKVLWITNVLLPEALGLLTGNNNTAGSGGWLSSSADSIKDSVDLTIATPTDKVNSLKKKEGNGIVYYYLPMGKGNVEYNSSYEPLWKDINKSVKPDLVHIHGTEYSHGLAYINACGARNVVVSIQGVMAEIAKHRNDGLSKWEILRNITIYDLKHGTLFSQQKRAYLRALSEIEIIKKVHFFIGRTTFDHAYIFSLNPHAQYFHCDESMRDVFYEGMWCYEACKPHSIYISSAAYPLKGLHMLLNAMPLILRVYSDTQIVVAGRYRNTDRSLKSFFYQSGYEKILNSLIKKYQIESHITFIGMQDACGVKKSMLNSNLVLTPSSCENSSNSICEAQLLGVPCLASYVGGTPDMISESAMGELYNFYDTNMLAYKICDIFEKSKYFNNTIMREKALQRNDREKNAKRTIEIYKDIENEIRN